MKRLIALLLVAVMILGTGAALAEKWTCPSCGKTGISSKFCPDCGTAKPGTTNIKVGDYVYFGHFEQNNYDGDGAEKIRWLVIDVKDGKLFLLSEKALANLPFNKKSDGSAWAACSLRQWLNNDFILSAFNSEETAAIQTTVVEDTAEHSYYDWNTAGRLSGTTEDKVFCLSYYEVRSMLSQKDIYCEPTASVTKKNVLVEKNNGHAYCYYWLRTSAFKNNAGIVNPKGGFETAYEHYPRLTVRPALWVDASAVSQ